MAKNKGKNNNYQTETRRAADLIAKHEEAQRSRHKMLPHRLTTTEKKHLKLKTTQTVSYTHLDVYKRQSRYWQKHRLNCRAIS